MSDSEKFTHILQEWAEIFVHHSICEFRQFSKDFGLSIPQMGTLFYLYHHQFCGVSDISDHLGITNAAASQLIDRLVQDGLITRSEDPEDRRSKKIVLTERGLALVQDSIERRRRWLEELTVNLTPNQQDEIINALTLLTQAAQVSTPTPSITLPKK